MFRSAGRICDASGKVDYGRVLVHISFTSQDDFSASSFAEHFRDDISTPEASLNGPKIRHFINTLRSAGNDWKKVHFTTHINPIPLQRIK
ncbi:MAG: hypothetical protein JWO78_480 [Micavibrio sp.]|nr:hypothetical protein [Micavibrio sp.]